MKGRVSRRQFLAGAAIVSVGAVAASCTPAAPEGPKGPVDVAGQAPAPATGATAVPEQAPSRYQEAPELAERVERGTLPPVEERLPENPVVVQPIESVGQYGESWTMLVASASDTKLAHSFGYTRLVGWDQSLTTLVPDLCESFENSGSKEFTFHLRKGLKWSDGEPFTSEDFRFYWEDMANNVELSPNGPNSNLLAGGESPTVTFPDDYTIKCAWTKPNTIFLEQMANGMALEIFAPRHYLQQFHASYADKGALDKLVQDEAHQDWMALFGYHNRFYNMDDPAMPTMQPWLPSARPPQEKYEFLRNPYYHKVDPDGKQLPYLDKAVWLSTDSGLVAMKCTTGDSDFQPRALSFDDITLLKEGEAQGGYKTLLWRTAQDSVMYIYPNQTCLDPVMSSLNRDKRFRIALSHAIDRNEINEVLFLGYGVPQQPEIMPGLPGYSAELAQLHTEFDLDKANALLDEMGLEWDAGHEYRLRPDGTQLDIVLEDAGEQKVYPDIIELITSTWKQIGINLLYKASERTTFRQRVVSGEASLSVYLGEGGRGFFWGPTPERRIPMDGGSGCLWGPAYGLYWLTSGTEGVEPPPEVQKLQDLASAWLVEADQEKRTALLLEIRQIAGEERFEIGTVGALPIPVVLKNGVHNVASEGLHSFLYGGIVGWMQPCQIWKE